MAGILCQPDFFFIQEKKKSHCPLASSTKGCLTKGLGLSLTTEDNLPEEGTRTLVQEAPFCCGHGSLLFLDGMGIVEAGKGTAKKQTYVDS